MVAKAFRKILCGVVVCAAGLPAQAAVCVGGSLNSYLALGASGCTVGALTFSDFVVDTFPGPTATQIAPGTLSIAPIAGGFALSSDTGPRHGRRQPHRLFACCSTCRRPRSSAARWASVSTGRRAVTAY